MEAGRPVHSEEAWQLDQSDYALDTFSSSRMGFRIFALFVSTMQPLVTISSAGHQCGVCSEVMNQSARAHGRQQTGTTHLAVRSTLLTENEMCLFQIEHDI